MITIIDYKSGNVGSIENMLKKVGADSLITSDPEKITNATKLILPGIGAFGNGVYQLKNLGIWDVMNHKVLVDKIPILGICLGAQLMTNRSEESTESGLGWINSETVRFNIDNDSKLKIPSIGWFNAVLERQSKLFANINEDNRFYFLHSYYFKSLQKDIVLSSTSSIIKFASAFEQENILGVQFHPEKSQKYGMQLLSNFYLNY